MTIDEVIQTDREGNVIWTQKNIPNIFHINGQEYLLRIAFNTSYGISIPSSYYLGLDNRTNLLAIDNLTNLSEEPTQNGYNRQPVSSASGFDVAEDDGGNIRATSSVVTFMAIGGSWGPVRNLFLATSSNNVGFLLSTATFDSPRTLADGQAMTMRISVGLASC